LYWTPRMTEDARTLLSHITHYTDWLADEPEYHTARANPFRKATLVEQRMNWCAYYHRECKVFLCHLNDPKSAQEKNPLVRKIKASSSPIFRKRPTKRFPEGEIVNFLENGWVRRSADSRVTEHDFIDYKGRAITILKIGRAHV